MCVIWVFEWVYYGLGEMGLFYLRPQVVLPKQCQKLGKKIAFGL